MMANTDITITLTYRDPDTDKLESTPIIDTVPNAFSFTSQANVDLDTDITSNTVTITGLTAAANISITGGTYSINGGSFTSSAGTITNGQLVAVKVRSSVAYSTPVAATVTIGGVVGAFTVTTEAESVGVIAQYLFNGGDVPEVPQGSFSFSDIGGKVIEAPAGETEEGLIFTFGGSRDLDADQFAELRYSHDDMGEFYIKMRMHIQADYYHQYGMRLVAAGDTSTWAIGQILQGSDGTSQGTINFIDGTGKMFLINVDNNGDNAVWNAAVTNLTTGQTRTCSERFNEPDNNKLLALWCDDENLTGDNDGYSARGASPTIIFEMRHNEANNDGSSDVYYHFGANRNVVGTLPNSTSAQALFIELADRGKWFDLAFHVKMATSELAEDGVIEFWVRKEGEPSYTLFFSQTNCQIGPRADAIPPNSEFGHGYILGAWNVPPLNATDIAVSEFILYDTKPGYLP